MVEFGGMIMREVLVIIVVRKERGTGLGMRSLERYEFA